MIASAPFFERRTLDMFIRCMDRKNETRELTDIHINSEDIRRIYILEDTKKAAEEACTVVAELRTANIHKEVLCKGTRCVCEAFKEKLISLLGVFEFQMEGN